MKHLGRAVVAIFQDEPPLEYEFFSMDITNPVEILSLGFVVSIFASGVDKPVAIPEEIYENNTGLAPAVKEKMRELGANMSMTLYDGLVIVNMSLPDNTYTTVSYNILEGYIAKMFNRSIVMNKKGEHDAAIAHINKALELNSEYSCAYAFRGDAYYMERQKLQAIDDLKNALQLLPDNQWAKDKLKKILG